MIFLHFLFVEIHNMPFLRWRPAQGRDLGKYRSRHVAVNHKTDMRKDSKMALDINIVNVNIDVNFGQVSA